MRGIQVGERDLYIKLKGGGGQKSATYYLNSHLDTTLSYVNVCLKSVLKTSFKRRINKFSSVNE